MSTLEASNQSVYLATNGAETAFALTSARLASRPAGMYGLGSCRMESRNRDLVVTPFGRGNSADTFDAKLFVLKRGDSDWDRELWCSFTCALGTLFGVLSSDLPTTSDRMVNVITAVTMSAYASAMLSAKGALPYINHSPTGAAQARLIFPDMCNHEFVQLEGMRTAGSATAAASYNWLLEKGT